MSAPSAQTASGARSGRSFYRPELDAVRFIAFLAVFCHHTFIRQPENYPFSVPVAQVLASLVNASAFGLSLFFTLSAYLICELLLREKTVTGTVDLPRFYKRRILRIWPLYFLGLGLGAVYAFHYGNFGRQAPWFVAYSLMVGNVYTGLHGWGGIATGPAGPLWSISIEEQFYLIWPAVARFCSERRIYIVACLIVIISNLSLVYFGSRHTDVDGLVWTNSFVQFYMFGAGILLSLFLNGRMPILATLPRVALSLAGLGCWFLASFVYNLKTRGQLGTIAGLLPGYFLIAAGCIAIMVSLMGVQQVPRWIATLGRLSYGLYVFHMLAIQQCQYFFVRHHPTHYILLAELPALAITILLAAFSYRYFEEPFRRLKNREAIIHSEPPPSLQS